MGRAQWTTRHEHDAVAAGLRLLPAVLVWRDGRDRPRPLLVGRRLDDRTKCAQLAAVSGCRRTTGESQRFAD